MSSGGSGCLAVAGGVGSEVVLEGRQEMTQDGYTPGFAKQPLPATPPQISHISVMIRKSKQPVQEWAIFVCTGEYVYYVHDIVVN